MKLGPTSRYFLATTAMLCMSAVPALAVPTNYVLVGTTLLTPTAVNNQGGKFTGFDISFTDPITGFYYVADRSNNAVDVLNGSSHALIGQVGVGLFGGQQASTAVSGPDGVVVVNSGGVATLYAGNGSPVVAQSSTLLTFNVNNPAAAVQQGSVNTGGTFRVDEMAFDPVDKLLIVANNADAPAFATLIHATPPTPTTAVAHITIPGQVSDGGMEQSVWDPNTHTFFVSIPSFNGSDPGGVAQIGTNGAVINTYNFATLSGGSITSCSSSGLALGGSGKLMVGCGNAGSQTVILDPTANGGNGAIVDLLFAVSGSDELWYDPVSGRFYATGVNAAGDRVIDIFADGTFALLQSIDLTALGADHVNAHSVAVNPLNGDLFVPLPGTTATATDTLCPNGCIAVFSERVPEPSSLTLLTFGVLGVLTTTWFRARAASRLRPGPRGQTQSA